MKCNLYNVLYKFISKSMYFYDASEAGLWSIN